MPELHLRGTRGIQISSVLRLYQKWKKQLFLGKKNIMSPSNSQGIKLKTLSVQTVVRGTLGSEVPWTDSNWEAWLELHLVVTQVSDQQEFHH